MKTSYKIGRIAAPIVLVGTALYLLGNRDQTPSPLEHRVEQPLASNFNNGQEQALTLPKNNYQKPTQQTSSPENLTTLLGTVSNASDLLQKLFPEGFTNLIRLGTKEGFVDYWGTPIGVAEQTGIAHTRKYLAAHPEQRHILEKQNGKANVDLLYNKEAEKEDLEGLIRLVGGKSQQQVLNKLWEDPQIQNIWQRRNLARQVPDLLNNESLTEKGYNRKTKEFFYGPFAIANAKALGIQVPEDYGTKLTAFLDLSDKSRKQQGSLSSEEEERYLTLSGYLQEALSQRRKVDARVRGNILQGLSKVSKLHAIGYHAQLLEDDYPIDFDKKKEKNK